MRRCITGCVTRDMGISSSSCCCCCRRGRMMSRVRSRQGGRRGRGGVIPGTGECVAVWVGEGKVSAGVRLGGAGEMEGGRREVGKVVGGSWGA